MIDVEKFYFSLIQLQVLSTFFTVLQNLDLQIIRFCQMYILNLNVSTCRLLHRYKAWLRENIIVWFYYIAQNLHPSKNSRYAVYLRVNDCLRICVWCTAGYFYARRVACLASDPSLAGRPLDAKWGFTGAQRFLFSKRSCCTSASNRHSGKFLPISAEIFAFTN